MNDNQNPALRAGLDAVARLDLLRLVWSANLRPVGSRLLPWERFISWLWHND